MGDVVDGVKTYADVGSIITLMKQGVTGCFEIAEIGRAHV